ncbi:branched-chain amino acid aminotransferase [Nocardiopsis alba]|uniref:Branched-chain amino acid aminotransferase n=1 Tax=Nocardiopsis alba TaxID=53437 RepID=A0A7K2ITE4_9ACTN|nr:aminotransferase class IV family protein [Nocardiopsis alba]MYR33094.1 branched-chain amino acid aminotransferase [Nocardiopsis alba]
MTNSITRINDREATAQDLAPMAFAGYVHFTAMQVRDGAVRGLDLHLDRLRTASDRLFGRHLSDDTVLGYLRSAVENATPDATVTAYVTSRSGEFQAADPDAGLDMLVKVTDPATPPEGPLALDIARHERELPEIKHVGEIAKTHYLRLANDRGFDDAAFEDRQGRLSEATIWNLAFWDGESVIWPEADMLTGITMRILDRRLQAMGVPRLRREVRKEDLSAELAAVVMNSWSPAIPVSRVGDRNLSEDPTFAKLLHEAFASESPVRL